MDSFDASGYQRPGQVLHMLRWMYGDKRFFGALRAYLLQYQHKNADTHQFFASIEKTLGDNLDWFENEWFYRAAYPHFYVKEHYDGKTETLTLDVTQRNHDGKPFRMPVDVITYFNDMKTAIPTRFTADSNHQVITIAHVSSSPQMVLFDPNNNIIRKLDDDKSAADLGYQAIHAPYVSDRLWALDNLGKAKGIDKAAAATFVRQATTGDAFYGVRVKALDAAAALDDAETIRLALHDKDPRVAIAAGDAVESLDHPGNSALVADLTVMTRASNPLVAGAALRGLGATKTPAAYALLVAGLNRHAFREPIARGALTGLASFGDLRAVPLIRARTAYGVDETERQDAIAALGSIAKKQPALAKKTLLAIAKHDPFFRARSSAVRALEGLNQRSVIPALQWIQTHDTQNSVRNAAWDAIQNIRDNAGASR